MRDPRDQAAIFAVWDDCLANAIASSARAARQPRIASTSMVTLPAKSSIPMLVKTSTL
jgi:hypothetical protein